MQMIKVIVDGKEITCDKDKTILEALKDNGIKVPTLCYHPDLKPEGRCRVCVVEVDGKLMTSCDNHVKEGMDIVTNSEKVINARKLNAELISAHHLNVCSDDLEKNELCEIVSDLGLSKTRFKQLSRKVVDSGNPSIYVDPNKCILCGRCVQACQKVQEFDTIGQVNRGVFTKVSPAFELPLDKAACTYCGQCSLVCPVGAIQEKDDVAKIMGALDNKKKHVVVQTAPSVRASLGECFGMEPGTLVTGKMVASLRKLGFDKVFDTNLGADMTIMEEASEFIHRVKNNGPFPMITTCCPAWIKFMEDRHSELFPHMSSCKSPHEMLGILTKTYYAKNEGIPKKDIVVVSIMPCTAKKFESSREEFRGEVDYVLTVRELARLIHMKKIDFVNLPDEDFDPALGISTGAGAIFGASGGVMEAALRTAYELATGSSVTKLEFDQIRGYDGIKEGTIVINGTELKFAVAHSGKNIQKLLEKKDEYHFIEMMACPGGCIGGGGQPIPTTVEIRKKRMQALYEADSGLPLRKSHENPIVKTIYDEFLDAPLSKKAHKLLHTSYKKRKSF